MIQICNIALARIGVTQTISSIDEASQQARVCKLFYEHCRDRVLRAFNWPFARTVKSLALVAEDPDIVWSYSYRLPTDCIRVHRILTALGDADPHPPVFELAAGGLLLTNVEDCQIEYTARVTDTNQFDPDFGSALAWLLAVEIAMPLAIDRRLREQALAGYQMELSAASTAAANERQGTLSDESSFTRERE